MHIIFYESLADGDIETSGNLSISDFKRLAIANIYAFFH